MPTFIFAKSYQNLLYIQICAWMNIWIKFIKIHVFMCALNPQSSQNEHYKYCTTLLSEDNYLAFQSWCKQPSNVKRLSLNIWCWSIDLMGRGENRPRGGWGELQVGAQAPRESKSNRNNRKVNRRSRRSSLPYVGEDQPLGIVFYICIHHKIKQSNFHVGNAKTKCRESLELVSVSSFLLSFILLLRGFPERIK